MNKRDLLSFLIGLSVVLIMKYAAGIPMTEQNFEWYYSLKMPDLIPPNYVFIIAWSIIYSLIAGAVANLLLSYSFRDLTHIAFSFTVHMTLHVLWSYLFFGLQNPRYGFYCITALFVSILLIIYQTSKLSWLSTILLAPYLLWVGFATYVSWMITFLNPG